MASPYPFTAIVGQDDMKRALLAAVVDPSLGGVLILGDRGTGKSTAVRGLAALLPDMQVMAGCRYGCDPAALRASLCPACQAGEAPGKGRRPRTERMPVPVVDLPLGATADRVLGALVLQRALTQGEKHFEPGLLARAHRGFLYIDEVNLLEDHLVDLLIDVAASGENVVEREGLSVRHAARFVLVGSGNPEEGELRPQLLDRFGLAVDVSTPRELAPRIEVVRRREAHERDPEAFARQWAKAQAQLRRQLLQARQRVKDLVVPDEVLTASARLCLQLGTDGLRGEITLMRAARALAALEGADTVNLLHLRQMAPAALRHRLRRNPLDDAGSGVRVQRAVDELVPA